MLTDHPTLGKEIEYTDSRKEGSRTGTVTGVRSRSQILDMKTGKVYPAIQLRIKPSDGGRAFWTASMRDSVEREGAANEG